MTRLFKRACVFGTLLIGAMSMTAAEAATAAQRLPNVKPGSKIFKQTGKPVVRNSGVDLTGKAGPGQPTVDLKGKAGPGQPTVDLKGKAGPGQPTVDLKGKAGPGQPTVDLKGKAGPGQPTTPANLGAPSARLNVNQR